MEPQLSALELRQQYLLDHLDRALAKDPSGKSLYFKLIFKKAVQAGAISPDGSVLCQSQESGKDAPTEE